MNNQRKTFVYAEGRENISTFMADSVKKSTLKYGWVFRQLYSLRSDKILGDEIFDDALPEDGAIILRNMPKNTVADIEKIRFWLKKNNYVSMNFNAVGGLMASNDKQFHQFILSYDKRTRDYALPSYEVANQKDVKELLRKKIIHYPFILKPRGGSVGKGIVFIKDEAALMMQKTWPEMLAQQFIESDYDWRVYVVGGVAIGALRRGGKDDTKPDFHAYANGIEKTPETDPVVLAKINTIACECTAVTGLEYSGCDIIRDKNTGEYYLLEVNTAATWEGDYDKILNLDIGRKLLEWCDERMMAKKTTHAVAMRRYAHHRLDAIAPKVAKEFHDIIGWRKEAKTTKKRDLKSRLRNAYAEIQGGKDVTLYKALLDEVENMPMCWAGNFIGSDVWGEDGAFEDDCIPTAYYLAIREKYDKIARVN